MSSLYLQVKKLRSREADGLPKVNIKCLSIELRFKILSDLALMPMSLSLHHHASCILKMGLEMLIYIFKGCQEKYHNINLPTVEREPLNNLKPEYLFEAQILETNNDLHPAGIHTPEKPREIIFTMGEGEGNVAQMLTKDIITLNCNFK